MRRTMSQPESIEEERRRSGAHTWLSCAEEVDTVMEQVAEAGATVVKAAQKTSWGGYDGYFQAPDEHLREVVSNPKMLPSD